MGHITVLYPEEQSTLSTVACIIGTVEVFARAESLRKQQGLAPKYTLQIAGTSTGKQFVEDKVAVKPDLHFSAIKNTHLVIIPSAIPLQKGHNKTMLDWIRRQYKEGAELASMCSGAFILGATGILEGKNCSTHWSLTDRFRDMYPGVNLGTDKLITDEKGIYTNGGAYSFLNLVIYLVEKYYDRPTAINCCKIFQIEPDRNSQSAFSIFTGQKQHGDEVVQQAQLYLEKHTGEKISMEQLSARYAVGRRNFDRRFIRATGITPLEYAQRVKIEAAKKALETTRKNIHEVMYDVGYADVKAFREVFRKITGLSPLEYRGKYNHVI